MSDQPEAYTLEITEKAEKQLKDLDKAVIQRIGKKLAEVAAAAEERHHSELTGDWAGHYRVRIGDYRAIYTMDTEKRSIIVVVVGHRRDIYDE
jgi:mRNA interferase RelE/StbE